MWIDTHCHLDAAEFDGHRDAVVQRARAAGVGMLVIPVGGIDDHASARAIARQHGFAYALGMHPLWLEHAAEDDIERLRTAVQQSLAEGDGHLVAVGEIGIDGHVPGLDMARQEWFFREQLRVARDAQLPVIVHVRRSADLLLKHLRRIDVPGGIVHAWNGSAQQADQMIALGLRLGFGGSLTYSGSQRIRRHAATVVNDAWVLETDAPYILPEWRRMPDRTEASEPGDLARIAASMAQLRGMSLAELQQAAHRNSVAALPRLAPLLAAANA